MVEIKEVKTRKDIKEFIEFPLRLYKNVPYFVPPLYGDEKKLLQTGGCNKNADSVFYLAVRDGKTVGRIHGIIQKEYNARHNTRKARFTRFDSIDDGEVAQALFDAVEKWGAAHGMQELCGPLGFNDMEREGLLVEGFEELATFEEQYNYAYYGPLLEGVGFAKEVDWLEFELRRPERSNEMLKRAAQRSLEINHLHLGDMSLPKRKYIEKYRDGFFECLDRCYRHLYGVVELTRAEQDDLISQFMLLIDKKYAIFICDEQEKVVGFGLCFPSLGKALQKSGGRLTLPAICRVLRAARDPKGLDLALVAVLPEYQLSGVNAVLLNFIAEALESGCVETCESNLNLETNTAVMAQWKYFNARQHKRRRAYIKQIGE